MTAARMMAWLPVCALLAAGAAHGEIFRCKQADGQTSYQDTPCASGEQRKVGAPATVSHDAPAAGKDYKSQYAEVERRRLVREAIEERRPMVSMTRAELTQAMGKPDKASGEQSGGVMQEQLTYFRNGSAQNVVVKDGIVVLVQDTLGPALAVTPPPPVKRPCPSEQEIRKIEVDISSIRNRDNIRLQAELQKRLREAKACQ